MKALPSERGQAMILIVLSIIVLFGFAALAVDMGQVFAARRNAQNAADAAALAAAYDASAGSKNADTAVQVAFDMAKTNGYANPDEETPQTTPQTVWVYARNKPLGGAYCEGCEGVANPEDYYQVEITVLLQPIFAQFIFNGIEKVKVEAVAHATSADDMSAGNALMSLSKSDDSMVFDGNTGVDVTGGNIRSNGRLTKRGCSGSIKVDESKPADQQADIIYGENSAEGFTFNLPENPSEAAGCVNVVAPEPEYEPPVNISGFKAPACPKLADVKADTDWQVSADGSYYSKEDTTHGQTTYYHPFGLKITNLPSGIHCIDGNYNEHNRWVADGIDKGDYSGSDVLIVLLQGPMKLTGNDAFRVGAATDIKDANGNQYGGLLFYAPPSNTSKMEFGGNSNTNLYGTFFAPGATCDVGGNSLNEAYRSAIICNTIKVHGTPAVKINFAPEQLFHFPPRVELVQ